MYGTQNAQMKFRDSAWNKTLIILDAATATSSGNDFLRFSARSAGAIFEFSVQPFSPLRNGVPHSAMVEKGKADYFFFQVPGAASNINTCESDVLDDSFSNRSCVFPFYYDGVSYTNCTTMDSESFDAPQTNMAWCSLTEDFTFARSIYAKCASCSHTSSSLDSLYIFLEASEGDPDLAIFSDTKEK